MKVFEHFGFQSGRDVNKFANCEVELRAGNGLLYLPKYTNAYLSGKVVNGNNFEDALQLLTEKAAQMGLQPVATETQPTQTSM